jgi:hypothetical protein
MTPPENMHHPLPAGSSQRIKLCPNIQPFSSLSLSLSLSLLNKKWGNDENCLFCSLSHSWFHSLQNKAHHSLSLTPLSLPTPRPCFSSWSHPLLIKAHCPYLMPPPFACPLTLLLQLVSSFADQRPSFALAFSQMLLKTRPAKRSCCTIFSQPASLLIKLLDMR